MVTPEIIKKYKSKKLGWLLAETQKRVNKYIRLRDSENGYFKCISCGRVLPNSSMNAGHYFPVGHFGIIRFNLDNIHSQCEQCNCFKDGNLAPYTFNLRRKIGDERFQDLEKLSQIQNFKWDRIVVIHILEKFKDFK